MQNSQEVVLASRFTDFDITLFKWGKHYRLYEKLGSHLMEIDGQKGTYFAVWAPSAKEVSVIGNFNQWSAGQHKLFPRWDASGIWEGFIPNIGQGTIYKYGITSYNNQKLTKGDPFAFYWETPPRTASIVWDLNYKWNDNKWLKKRKDNQNKPQPYSIYEVHLGSWKRKIYDGNHSLTYKEHAVDLVNYVKDLGFSHVELMPIAEHPYDPSWGYQVTGYYAPTSRFGTPEEFMFLMDAFHQADIGVILDWVPSHFPSDAHGLANFDGTHLYEHADPRQGFHPDWKTYIYNYGKNEVRAFLISNALFWLDKYHIDGLRVDAVASMLYLDYSRDEGQWIPNKYGGNENLEAISFLKEFNETVYSEYPDTVTIAEESTSWTGVSRPTYDGGLGFGQKWMMGWMHDTLNYFKRPPIYRQFHQNDITFSMMYAYSENFMLPLSHDEVVHGKASLINKMPGDEWQRFANLRLLYGYMFTHPGSHLLFMGGEFAQTSEWGHERELDWGLLQYDFHKGIQSWIRDLNQICTSKPSMFHYNFDPKGFEWVALNDHKNSVLVYLRKGENTHKPLLVVCNLAAKTMEDYHIGVPAKGEWKEILNSDDKKYQGSGILNDKKIKASTEPLHAQEYSISIKLAPLAVMIFEPLKLEKPKGNTTRKKKTTTIRSRKQNKNS